MKKEKCARKGFLRNSDSVDPETLLQIRTKKTKKQTDRKTPLFYINIYSKLGFKFKFKN